jgi:hypothetical protein
MHAVMHMGTAGRVVAFDRIEVTPDPECCADGETGVEGQKERVIGFADVRFCSLFREIAWGQT